MKIIVDKMPSNRDECPYSVDKSTMDMIDYKCSYKTECDCTFSDNMNECRYFIGIRSVLSDCSDTLEDILDGSFEKVPFDNRYQDW